MVLTPSFLSVLCSFLSSVAPVLCTAFFFLRPRHAQQSRNQSGPAVISNACVHHSAAHAVTSRSHSGGRAPGLPLAPHHRHSLHRPQSVLGCTAGAVPKRPLPSRATSRPAAPAHRALAARADLRMQRRVVFRRLAASSAARIGPWRPHAPARETHPSPHAGHRLELLQIHGASFLPAVVRNQTIVRTQRLLVEGVVGLAGAHGGSAVTASWVYPRCRAAAPLPTTTWRGEGGMP
jgi:hypothetical protein